jgi:Asp-tRNA(Asn)/Glu-tRNA(Gln) amidotransferase C subunit
MLAKKPDRRSIDSFYSRAIKTIAMKNAVQRLNAEYRLNLSEEEIEAITQQAEAAQQLFQKLFEVNVEGVAPALKIDPAEWK